MPLKAIDIERLEQFKKDIELLKLRFPVAEIAFKIRTDKGNISAYMNGKKPLSKKFLERFYKEFFPQSLYDQPIEPGHVTLVMEQGSVYRPTESRKSSQLSQEEILHRLQNMETLFSELLLATKALNTLMLSTMPKINQLIADGQVEVKKKVKGKNLRPVKTKGSVKRR